MKDGQGEMVLGKLSIEHLMAKAATTAEINDNIANSQLNRQQADKFIDLVVDTSVLMKNIRTVKVDFQKGEINKLDIGDICTESSRATGVSTFAPEATKIEYDTEKLRSCFDITSDFTEDNLEGPSIRDKLLNMFTKRIAIDLEILGLQGAYAASPSPDTRRGRLLMSNDGFIKILTDNVPSPSQQIDAEGASASAALYYKMKNAVPSRYRVAGPDYRWVTPSRLWDKWNYDLTLVGSNGTATDVTAQYREMGGGGKPFGIPMFEVPLMPVDLAYTVGESPFTDGTNVLLTPLMNLVAFIQRDITIEWDRVPRSDKWEVTIHTRNDFQVENRDMVVIAKNVGVDGADFAL